MSYLPTSVQEMTQPDFDLRDINGVFSQYGILEHILLEPIAHSVNNQDLWRDLLSCFNVALSNSGWYVIIFNLIILAFLARFRCLFVTAILISTYSTAFV